MGTSKIGELTIALRSDLRMALRRVLAIDRRMIADYLRHAPVRRLQIGAGLNRRPGWLNTNFRPGRHDGVIHLDATKTFPLPDASFDYVFSEHMIEHIDFDDGAAMLSECARILKPGGRLRLSTPDLAFLIALQGQRTPLHDRYLDWALRDRNLPVEARPAAALNHYVRAWGHRFIYDRASLVAVLEAAGFGAVTAFAIDASDDPELRGLENAGRMPVGLLQLESMTFEAVRLPAAV